MTDIATAFALLFAFICVMLGINHALAYGRVSLLSWSLFAMAGVYGVGWSLVMHTTDSGENPFWEMWLRPNEEAYALHTIMAALLAVGVYLGWHSLKASSPFPNREALGIRRPECRVWVSGFWSLLILAVVAQLAYARAYGGLEAQLDYSSLVRSSVFEQVPVNSLSFLAPFPKCALVACFGFFGLMLSGHRTAPVVAGLLLSASLSVYIFYNTVWRLGFGMFLFTFLVATISLKVQSIKRQTAIICITGPMLLLLLDYLSSALDIKPAETTVEFISKEISFPFGGFFAHWSNDETHFRGFMDIAAIPAYLLPSSLWSKWLDTADDVNTALIMGASKGYSEVTASIPVDAIILGFLQAHVLGVLVVGFLFGVGLKMLQRALDTIPIHGVRATFQASMALVAACFPLFYADPSLIVTANFHWIIGLALVMIMSRYGEGRGWLRQA